MLNNCTRERIIILLQAMQSEQASAAEKELFGLAKASSFMTDIYFIIREHSQEWVKTIACSFLNRMFSQQITEILQETLFNTIVGMLTDDNISSLNKRCFERSIVRSLEQCDECTMTKWKDAILSMLQHKSQLDSAYLLIACFAVADINQIYLNGVISIAFEQTFSLQVCLENAGLLNEIVKMWIVVFDKLLLGSDDSALKNLIGSKRLQDFIDVIYELEAPENIYICLNEKIYDLNMLKYEAADLNKRVAEYAGNHMPSSMYSLEALRKNMPRITASLILVVQERGLLDRFECEDFVIAMVSLTIIYFQHYPAANQLQWMHLLDAIVFPLLEVTKEQMVSFDTSAEDFMSLAEDCCDKQLFGTLKTEAAKLLQVLSDKVTGSQQYTVKRCVDSLKRQLRFVVNNDQVSQLKIETCFMLLSILSYDLDDYPLHLADLKIILLDERVLALQPLETARMFLLLSYNYADIFTCLADGEKLVLQALNYSGHPTVVYFALDYLFQMVNQYYTDHFLRLFSDRFIVDYNKAKIWQICNKMVGNHYGKMSKEGLEYFGEKLYERIKKQFIEINNGTKTNTLDLVKAFQVLQQLPKQMGSDPNMQKNSFILSIVWQAMSYFEQAVPLSVQDEIVKIVHRCSIQSLDERVYMYLPRLLQSFVQNGLQEKVYFRLFNHIIMKGQTNRLDGIIDVLKKAFIKHVVDLTKASKKVANISLGIVLIVLQNLIGMHGIGLSVDLYTEIICLCVRMLPLENINSSKHKRVLLSRVLNLLLLCHLHVPCDALTYLRTYANYKLYHGYDTKVMTMCVSKIVCKETQTQEIVAILKIALEIIGASEEIDTFLLRKKSSQGGKINRVSLAKSLGNYDKILKSIETPFNSVKSAKEQIKNIFTLMHKNNPPLYAQVVNGFTPQMKLQLADYLSLCVVEKKERIIRKVVGVKGFNRMEDYVEEMEEDESDSQDELLYKRQRKQKKKNANTGQGRKREMQLEIE